MMERPREPRVQPDAGCQGPPPVFREPYRLCLHHAVHFPERSRCILASPVLSEQPRDARSNQRGLSPPAALLRPRVDDGRLGRRAQGGHRRAAADASGKRRRDRAGKIPGRAGRVHHFPHPLAEPRGCSLLAGQPGRRSHGGQLRGLLAGRRLAHRPRHGRFPAGIPRHGRLPACGALLRGARAGGAGGLTVWRRLWP